MGQSTGPDFIDALARGLEVIRAFGTERRQMSLSEVATSTGLTRPTAHRNLLTLAQLGYVRALNGQYELTPRVLELGMAYVSSSDLWTITRPRLEDLVALTNESCSIAQLDGSDIVYVARVAVPKLVTLSVTVGTRFPAFATSLGKVLLADLDADALRRTLATPSLSPIKAAWTPTPKELTSTLDEVRANGFALTDQHLAAAIRSVAAPIRDAEGVVVAAVNVNANAIETSVETLLEDYLPKLLTTAAEISRDWRLWDARPLSVAHGR
jgi:IclR family transcriptional regulator, pca regulon regulatory protein